MSSSFSPVHQKGSILIESLIAILIFSIGILAVAGLQATAISLSNDSKYRSEAALLANELVGQMWSSNRANLSANFANSTGNSGTTAVGYQQWAWAGYGTNQGTTAAPAAGSVLATLPVPSGSLPTVTITPDASTGSNLVVITVFWRSPSDNPNDPPHKHVVQTQISGG